MRVWAAVLLLSLLAPVANAVEIHLKDGSIVYGEILELVDGEDLVVDTEYMDEVTIEWDSVVRVSGTQVVEVELFDGRREVGAVSVGEDGVSITGVQAVNVDPSEVFEMSDANETFSEALQAHTDLGMNIVRGNNRTTQVHFSGGVGYEASGFDASIGATMIVNEQTAAEDTRRVEVDASYTYKLGNNWNLRGLYQFESDEKQNLEDRSLYGGAIERRIVNQRRHRVELYGGLALNSEKFTGTPRSQTPEGVLGARYRLRWAADADLAVTVFPNLEDSDRVRTQFDGSLSFDLQSDLDFKITVFNRYDSQPLPGNEKNDTGLTLGLSWEY